jgi:hypothetical protein
VEFGAHLPQMDFGGHPFTLDQFRYARTAEQLGFDMLCANPEAPPIWVGSWGSDAGCGGSGASGTDGHDVVLHHGEPL